MEWPNYFSPVTQEVDLPAVGCGQGRSKKLLDVSSHTIHSYDMANDASNDTGSLPCRQG